MLSKEHGYRGKHFVVESSSRAVIKNIYPNTHKNGTMTTDSSF